MTKFSKLITGFCLGLLVLLTIGASIDYRALNVTQFSALNTVSIISGAPLTNSFIKDLSGKLSLGATARFLYDAGGIQKSLDWDARVQYDSVGIASQSWGARTLTDSTGTTSLNWDSRFANRADTTRSLDWSLSRLYSSTGVTDPTMDWSLRTFTGSGWVFLSITNHNDVSAGAFASGNVWGYNGLTGKWTNGPPSAVIAATGTTNAIAMTLRDPTIGDGNNGVATTNKTAFLNLFGNGALVKLSTNDASSLTNFALLTNSFGITFDGGGATIATNVTRYLVVPYNCTVVGFTMVSDLNTISVVDVMRTTYALFDAGSTHPGIADAITASLPPTINPSLYKTNVTSVGTWSASLTNNNIVAFRTITNTAATTLNLTLFVTHAL